MGNTEWPQNQAEDPPIGGAGASARRDFEAEAIALARLARALVEAPRSAFERVAATAQELCGAESAGISALECVEQAEFIRWRAVTGALSRFESTAMPRDASPCGAALEEAQPTQVEHPARFYTGIAGLEPEIREQLTVPYRIDGIPAGTLWVASHSPGRAFDTNDIGVLQNLAWYAAAAHQIMAGITAMETRAELERRVAERNAELSYTNERLREREEHYRELVEQIKDYAIFRVDLRGRAVTWNEGVERVLGYTEDEFLGRRVGEIFTPEAIEAGVPEWELEEAAKHGTASNDRWMRRKNGEYFFALGVTTAIRDSNGRVTGYTKLMRDHTGLLQAEAALKESERRFRMLADAMPQLVWEAEPTGEVTYYNARVSQFEGIRRDPDSGMWIWEPCIHPDDMDATARAWDHALSSGTEYRIEHRIQVRTVKGPRFRWFLSRAVPVRDTTGAIVKWYGTTTDIHALKKAEQEVRKSEERFRSMADAAPAVLWVTDRKNNAIFLSRAWEEFTGQKAEEGLGTGWTQCLHPDERDETWKLLETKARNREPFHVDYRIRRADGTYRWAIGTGRPRYNSEGEFVGYIGSVIDAHERKQAEEAVQRSHQDLEQRIDERTRELQQRAEQLSHLASELSLTEQRERQRLAQVLHDHLQQLLVGANLRLDILARDTPSPLRDGLAGVRKLLDEAIGASRSLTVELAPPILHEAGLAAGLEWLARWMREKHNLEVTLRVSGAIRMEREDVRIFLFQSVRELLFNVVKHAGVSQATVDVVLTKDDKLQIAVADLGKGFDPVTAFESDTSGASGFGLFTIRERLSLLGGGLDLETAPGRGSRFILTVPMYADGCAEERRIWWIDEPGVNKGVPEGRQAGETVRVLIVDDHEVMREGLGALLSDEPGIEVCGEAADGVEAVEKARMLHPDVVLMDFSLPRMDGVEATRRIKSELPDVEIIGLSMYEEPDRASALMGAGAAAYLTKSGNTDALLETIRSIHHLLNGGSRDQGPD